MTDLVALITKLANELEVASRREHYAATDNRQFDTCESHCCTARRALLDEAHAAAAQGEAKGGDV